MSDIKVTCSKCRHCKNERCEKFHFPAQSDDDRKWCKEGDPRE